MISNQHLSAYTPSYMQPEVLEQIFVQRHKLLEKSVIWIKEGITSPKKNHLLFIGPRGSGKTHLITMIINKLKLDNDISKEQLFIIWLGEDDVVMNLTGLALLIINKMQATYPNDFNTLCLETAKGKSADEVAQIILEDIKIQAGDNTLLVVKENMSDVFTGLKDSGQKKLRAYLQENSHINLLCTSQKLFEGVSSRDSAFWGFFDIHHLKPLSIEEAMELISKLAKLDGGKDDLVAFLKTPQGKYRVRALHYLAGGNHRLYVELSNFLTMASLDDFVSAIIQLADHLTPYFQERIRSLSPQQAAIVQKLCEMSGAIQVKVIAEALFMDEKSVAKQLSELESMGYVTKYKRGRLAFYEIAEPLLRLSLEVKNNHGKPLKIIASLFRAWFTDSELLNYQNTNNALYKSYSEMALKNKEVSELMSSVNQVIMDEMIDARKSEEFQKVLECADQILAAPNSNLFEKHLTVYNSIFANFSLENYQSVIDDSSIFLEMDNPYDDNEPSFQIRLVKSMAYKNIGLVDSFLEDLKYLIEENHSFDYIKEASLFERAKFLTFHEECKDAILDINELMNLCTNPEVKAKALLLRSANHMALDNYELALNDVNQALEIEDIGLESLIIALNTKGSYLKNYDIEESISLFEKASNIRLEDNTFYNFAYWVLPDLYYRKLDINKAEMAFINALNYSKKPSSNEIEMKYTLDGLISIDSKYWMKEIAWIIAQCTQYEALVNLSSALIQSIAEFMIEEENCASFKKWVSLWTEVSNQLLELQPAVDALNASLLALEEEDDKPLFALPKEIRELVLPMFRFKFGEEFGT